MNLLASMVELLPLFIILIVMGIPIAILFIVVLVKFIIKNVKRVSKKNVSKEDIMNKYLIPFGEDNIISISTNMRRVSVEVKDIRKIDIEGLKNLGVGVLITGNVVKCLSDEFAKVIENN